MGQERTLYMRVLELILCLCLLPLVLIMSKVCPTKIEGFLDIFFDGPVR